MNRERGNSGGGSRMTAGPRSIETVALVPGVPVMVLFVPRGRPLSQDPSPYGRPSSSLRVVYPTSPL